MPNKTGFCDILLKKSYSLKKILDQVCASCQVKYSTSQRFLLFVCLLFVPLYRIFHSYESSQVRSCCGNGHRARIRSSILIIIQEKCVMKLIPVAEHLTEELSLHVLTTQVCRGRDSNT